MTGMASEPVTRIKSESLTTFIGISKFRFLEFPVYRCPVEIKKRSLNFDYQILKKTLPERAAILCLEHDELFIPPEAVDVIELKALQDFLAV
jgi:hypothetical protein